MLYVSSTFVNKILGEAPTKMTSKEKDVESKLTKNFSQNIFTEKSWKLSYTTRENSVKNCKFI